MLKTYSFLILSLFFGLKAIGQTVTHPMTDEKFYYSGRWDKSSTTRYAADFVGSQVKFKFTGTSLKVKIRQYKNTWSESYVDVFIDGIRTDSFNIRTKTWYDIFSSDIAETHTVVIFKRSESFMGDFTFSGIELIGDLEEIEAPKPLKFLFSGASWETGFGNMPNLSVEVSRDSAYTSAQSNSYYSYPAIASRLYEAQYQCACFGGKGLTRDYAGDTIFQLPEIFFSTLGASKKKYDMQTYVPDVIFMDQGGNDFSIGIPDKEKFVNTYLAFLDSVRVTYPNAKIIISNLDLSTKDTLTDSSYTKAFTDYTNTVFELFSASNEEVYLWDYSENNIKIWGQDLHPNTITLDKMAQNLVQFIQTNLGLELGIRNENLVQNDLFYPNPVQDKIWIDNPSFETNITISDLNGKVVFKEKINGNRTINVENLEKGIWILQIDGLSTKFVKY